MWWPEHQYPGLQWTHDNSQSEYAVYLYFVSYICLIMFLSFTQEGLWATQDDMFQQLATYPCPHQYCQCALEFQGRNAKCRFTFDSMDSDGQCSCDRQGDLRKICVTMFANYIRSLLGDRVYILLLWTVQTSALECWTIPLSNPILWLCRCTVWKLQEWLWSECVVEQVCHMSWCLRNTHCSARWVTENGIKCRCLMTKLALQFS